MGNHYNHEIIKFYISHENIFNSKQSNKNLKVTLIANYSVLAKSLFEENPQALNL